MYTPRNCCEFPRTLFASQPATWDFSTKRLVGKVTPALKFHARFRSRRFQITKRLSNRERERERKSPWLPIRWLTRLKLSMNFRRAIIRCWNKASFHVSANEQRWITCCPLIDSAARTLMTKLLITRNLNESVDIQWGRWWLRYCVLRCVSLRFSTPIIAFEFQPRWSVERAIDFRTIRVKKEGKKERKRDGGWDEVPFRHSRGHFSARLLFIDGHLATTTTSITISAANDQTNIAICIKSKLVERD